MNARVSWVYVLYLVDMFGNEGTILYHDMKGAMKWIENKGHCSVFDRHDPIIYYSLWSCTVWKHQCQEQLLPVHAKGTLWTLFVICSEIVLIIPHHLQNIYWSPNYQIYSIAIVQGVTRSDNVHTVVILQDLIRICVFRFLETTSFKKETIRYSGVHIFSKLKQCISFYVSIWYT